ncbi:MAG: FHA domain-containing protein [Armatimonadetes bacterium]|nr:FHA domain-containing protein [Anaerolineae bacterium]
MRDENGQPTGDLSEHHDSERITNDVRREAEEALRLYNAMQQSEGDAPPLPKSGVFALGMMLRVEVQGSDKPIALMPKAETHIGRADPAAPEKPELDLSSYAAYQMGISRRHALIRWEHDQLYVLDLGSRNGTYVNGKQAQPHQPVKLRDGDELRMGKMSLKVYFRHRAD